MCCRLLIKEQKAIARKFFGLQDTIKGKKTLISDELIV